ncbi:MAG TPA: LCP family protein [Planosporangium sp.]|jgi:LCP family protein required for cell wall assembly|nr:LCP family protein [Planosporangium sp.]
MSRRWRVAIGAVAALVLVAVGGVTAAWLYGRSVNADLNRTNAFGAVPDSVPTGWPSAAPSAAPSIGPRPVEIVANAMNVLLLGSDSRDPATTAGTRSDTMMLVHLDADHRHAYVVSIPRDTWVHVPAAADGRHGNTMAKINAAYAWGGAPLAVRTVEAFTGVRIDHVVLIDFAGFQQVVDALGGVDLTVDQTITSIFPPHRTFTRGQRHFTGTEALDYVRQRYQFADGDFARERHQQQFLKALLDKAANMGTLSDVGKLNAFLRAVTRAVTVDENFDLVDVAMRVRHLRSADITSLTSPSAGTGWEGGQSVVRADTARARALYEAVRTDTVAQWLATTSASPAGSASPSPPAG